MSATKICPFCAEEILAEAIKCKHCQSMLQESAPPPSPAQPNTSSGDRSGNKRLLIAVLAAVILVIVAVAVLASGALMAIIHYEFSSSPQEEQVVEEVPPIQEQEEDSFAGTKRDLAEEPVKDTRQQEPDFSLLEKSLSSWITAETADDNFILLSKEELPSMEEFSEQYSEGKPVIAYKLESVEDTDVTILLGIPYGDAFTRLPLNIMHPVNPVFEEKFPIILKSCIKIRFLDVFYKYFNLFLTADTAIFHTLNFE